MAFLVVGHGPSPASLQRQTRLSAVQRLHLALVVNAEHDRVFRRAQLKPDDGLKLLRKKGVVADLEGL